MYEKLAEERSSKLLVIESELIELLLVFIVIVVHFSSVSSRFCLRGSTALSSLVIDESPFEITLVLVDYAEEIQSKFSSQGHVVLEVHPFQI